MYDCWRFRTIVCLMGLTATASVAAVAHRQFPMSLSAVLCLMPGLLRELDLRRGRPARRLGSLEWSCVVGGVMWLLISPLVR